MKLHEFIVTVSMAILLTFLILGWAANTDRLCVYNEARIRHCVVLEIR